MSKVIVHWLLLLEVLVLATTGFYLHRPTFGGSHGTALFMHLAFAYALFATVGYRIYWALFGEPAAFGRIFGGIRSRSGALAAGAHYTDYLVIWIALGLQAVTGLALRYPTENVSAAVIHGFGGMAGTRIAHYLLMWVLISALVVHVYQTALERGRDFTEIFVPQPVAADDGTSEPV